MAPGWGGGPRTPEDVGGPPGYMDFLQAMLDPKHEQHADYCVGGVGRSTGTPTASTRPIWRSANCAEFGGSRQGGLPGRLTQAARSKMNTSPTVIVNRCQPNLTTKDTPKVCTEKVVPTLQRRGTRQRQYPPTGSKIAWHHVSPAVVPKNICTCSEQVCAGI